MMDAAQCLTARLRQGQRLVTALSHTAREQFQSVHTARVKTPPTLAPVPSSQPPPMEPYSPTSSEMEITLLPQGCRSFWTFPSFEAANAQLRSWSRDADSPLTCDYTVRFPDGTLTAGSVHLPSDADLRTQIRRTWAFLAGLDPLWATPEEHQRILTANERRQPGITDHYRQLLERHRL